MYFYTVLLTFISLFLFSKGDCTVNTCNIPTLIYDDLKCVPKYGLLDDCCPQEYDCSHIENRPAGTCFLKGKYYNVGDIPNREDIRGRCDHVVCKCGKNNKFQCVTPSDTCAEFWVPEFVRPGCYLNYELNRCCANDQICPPFEGNAECEVNGVTYKQGNRFDHPTKKCTTCVCDNNFNGQFDAPICQRRNCTAELFNSEQIEAFCAPFYKTLDTCCPTAWVCPSDEGTYIPSTHSHSELQCKFGEKTIEVGGKYEAKDIKQGKVSCTCVIPPFLTCTIQSSA